MALPESRNRDYDASSRVVPADLNDLQDCTIGGKVGSRTWTFGASLYRAANTSTAIVVLNNTGEPTIDPGATPGTVVMEPPLPPGARVTAVTVWHKRASGSIVIRAFDRNAHADAHTQIGDSMTISAGAAIAGTAITTFTATTLAAGHVLCIQVEAGADNNFLYGVDVTFSVP